MTDASERSSGTAPVGECAIARQFGAAEGREFDLVIVGGGIYGASLLQEAARRGLTACLCDADDFGGATSWNSLRIVHGGLRYLQTLDLRRFFQSVAARRRVARQFPTLVRPLHCLMPLYGEGMKRKSVMRMAMLLNDLLSSNRNSGLEESVQLPRGGVFDATAARAAFPQVRGERLEGAAAWSDYFMISSERIVMELLRDAVRNGATALNYAAVLEVLVEDNAARGVRVRDRLTGAAHEIKARVVVNCAGSRVGSLASGRGGEAEALFRPSLAFNLLLDRTLATRSALAVAAPEPRAPVLFVVPQEKTLFAGTMHLPRPPDTTEAVVTEAEIAGYLRLLNASIPGLNVGVCDVRRVFAGLLPAKASGSNELVKRETLLDHGKAGGLERMYSVSGVKYTTANDVARQILAMMGSGGNDRPDTEQFSLSAASSLLTDAERVHAAESGLAASALRQTIAEESVHCLDDLVLRRANWATTEPNLDALRTRVSELIGLPDKLPGELQCV